MVGRSLRSVAQEYYAAGTPLLHVYLRHRTVVEILSLVHLPNQPRTFPALVLEILGHQRLLPFHTLPAFVGGIREPLVRRAKHRHQSRGLVRTTRGANHDASASWGEEPASPFRVCGC